MEVTTISAARPPLPNPLNRTNKRAMSYQSLNSLQKREPSLENRRMSFDSQNCTTTVTPTNLSIVGSEIIRGAKPKVKTMSEKDVTRRPHHNCFVRTSSYVS